MKILALEIEKPGVASSVFAKYLEEEARHAWQLYKNDIIRELYFDKDQHTAVLMLECSSIEEAEKYLSELPLVKNNLIEFKLIPLTNYNGFERLFNN